MGLLRDYMIKHHVNHTFWCLNDDSGDTGGLWKDIQFGVTRNDDGTINAKTTINWDTEKYDNYYYPAIWKTQTSKKFIGLDHQVALGSNGISLNEYYTSYASTEGSNLDGGKTSSGTPVVVEPGTTPITTTSVTTTAAPKTTTVTTTKSETVSSFRTETTTAAGSTTTTPAATGDTTSPASGLAGDVNEDGAVDMSDAVAIMRWYANKQDFPLSENGIKLGDVVGHDGLTNADALMIQRKEAGIIDTLPVD